jgi:hypothetical protein
MKVGEILCSQWNAVNRMRPSADLGAEGPRFETLRAQKPL